MQKRLKHLTGGGAEIVEDNAIYGIKTFYFHKNFLNFNQISYHCSPKFHIFQAAQASRTLETSQTIQNHPQQTKNSTEQNPNLLWLSYMQFKDLSFKPPGIEYLIFLDPDDYWEKDCLQECVSGFEYAEKMGEKAQIVWFDYSMIYENTAYNSSEERGFQTYFKCCSTPFLDSMRWAEITKQKRYAWGFAHGGMIDFDFFKDIELYWTNKANWQVVDFGIMLFIQASNIFMLNKQLYVHRARDNSISRFEKSQNISVPPLLQPLADELGSAYLARKYHKAVSAFSMTHSLALGLNRIEEERKAHIVREYFFVACLNWALSIFAFKKDPLGIKNRFVELKPYVKGLKLGKLNFLKHLIIIYPRLGFLYGWIYRLKHKNWLSKI